VSSAVDLLVDGGHFAPGALVVVERSSEDEAAARVGPLIVHDVRRYGTTTLLFATAD
jgi:16S rRNA G966 N2-methylase RsmD